MARILVVGMNPAWQSIISLAELVPGEVLRAKSAVSLASGKGINCARLLAKMGHHVTLMQTLAGEQGKRCLSDCERHGIQSLHVWVEGETRHCLTLRDENKNQVTEIIEPFAVDFQSAWSSTLLKQAQAGGRYDAMVILGTLPNGWQGAFYRDCLEIIAADLKVLDALQGLTRKDLGHAQWVKVNAEEWRAFQSRHSPENVPNAVSDSFQALITQGSEGAQLQIGDKPQWHFQPPAIDVMNPIGAGDTVTAGLVHHLLAGRDAKTAARHALAMGTASCLELLPAHFEMENAESLLPRIVTHALA